MIFLNHYIDVSDDVTVEQAYVLHSSVSQSAVASESAIATWMTDDSLCILLFLCIYFEFLEHIFIYYLLFGFRL